MLKPLPFVDCDSEDELAQWIEMDGGHPLDDKKEVIDYLKKGYCLSAVPGRQKDPLAGGKSISQAPHVYTDGIWVWRLTVVHWLRKYDVAMPEEFVNHVRSIDYEMPHLSKVSGQGYPWRRNSKFFLPESLKKKK